MANEEQEDAPLSLRDISQIPSAWDLGEARGGRCDRPVHECRERNHAVP